MEQNNFSDRRRGPDPSRKPVALTVLGKLHDQRATAWIRQGEELLSAGGAMRASYAPLRRAFNQLLVGKQNYAEAMETSMQKFKPTKQALSIIDNSREGLKFLREELMPLIASLDEDYVCTGDHPEPIPFGPVRMTGGFHARVTLKNGREAVIYLHPSSWTKNEMNANRELLGLVAGERHDLLPSDAIFVDIPKRTIGALPNSNSRLRHSLEQTADLYHRLFLR